MAIRQIRKIRIEGNLAFVPLTRGYEAVIDAADAPLVDGADWCAKEAWRKDGSLRTVYAMRRSTTSEGRKNILMHRLIMGNPAGLDVDHKDCDGLNNRRSNIRVATKSQNSCNQRNRSDNTSGHKGVSWRGDLGKWHAHITVGGKQIHLGYFHAVEEAGLAYVKASAEHHGEFRRTS